MEKCGHPKKLMIWFLASVCLLWCLDPTEANVDGAPNRHNKPNIIKVPMEQNDVPTGYVAYPIPAFSVQFKTINSLTGDPEVDAALLQSEMASPLKEVVGKFMKQSFEVEVAKLASEQSDSTPEIMFDFASLDFQVTIQHRFTQDQERARQLEASESDDDKSKLLEFYSEFIGQAYFIKPYDVSAVVPTEQEMHVWMLGWMNHNLEDLSDLTSAFRMSTVEILNNIQSLEVDTDIDVEAPVPFDGVEKSSDEEGKWDHAVVTTLLVFVCLFMIVVGAALFRYSMPYIVPYFQDHSIDSTHMNSHTGSLAAVFPPKTMDHERPMSPHRSTSSVHGKDQPLPGRRGDADEEHMLRQESDRWLQQHRPDLYEAVQKSHKETIGGEQQGNSHFLQGRSMPMQFLMGGLFKSQPSQQTQTGREGDFSEGQDPEAPFDENHSGLVDGSPNWWNKVLQGLKGHKLACDEDPTLYNFPFQDFPRHDGTPCLIYSETPEGLVRVVRSDGDARPLSPSNPLSNDEFKRVLSLNSEDVFVLEDPTAEENDEEDEIVFQTAPVTNQKPEFTDKLNRLVAMRHRHYERQNILHKHKKTREQRVQEEARQRELKLRRHEMELDMNEIEAQFSPRSIVRRSASSEISIAGTNGGSVSGANHNQAPSGDSHLGTLGSNATSTPFAAERKKSLHRTNMSNPDFMSTGSSSSGSRSGSGGGSFDMGSPFTGIPANPNKSSPSSILRKSPPRPDAKPSSEARKSAEHLNSLYPSPTSVIPSKNIPKSKFSRQRSHRRAASHGVDQAGDIRKCASVDCLDSRTNVSNAEDVMTFGIAAYTDFV